MNILQHTFLILSLTALTCCANASSPRNPKPNLDAYFSLLDQYPATLGPIGDHKKHEIEIVRDPIKIDEISAKLGRSVGIIHQDKYWIWINDAVQFPNGSYGIYGRISWMRGLTGPAGVAVLIISPTGKIILNRNFRHATRSWEFEMPRGLIEPNESPEHAAVREVSEETGWVVKDVHDLGEMAADSGMTNTITRVFLARAEIKEEAHQEASEAIEAIDEFTLDEVKTGLVQGYLTVLVDGVEKRIPMRDPFLTFALLQGYCRGALQLSPTF